MRISSLGNMITSHCTLRCQGCCAAIPQIEDPSHVPFHVLKNSFRKIFEVCEYVEEFALYGGEALLHPQIDDIITECKNYKDQIGLVRLMLNGTIAPKPSTVERLKDLNLNYDIQIDDYGKASYKLEEILNIVEENELPMRLIRYNEQEQYCGGWIDFGMEYQYKHYTPTQLATVFKNCHSRERCLVHWAGVIFRCQFAASGVHIGKVQNIEKDHVNLLENEMSNESIKQAIIDLDNIPVEACRYCNGFDTVNGKRIPAGKQ